ncbi:TPA: helix-turn-helix transcriptional regulator [Enterococcus faecalis]
MIKNSQTSWESSIHVYRAMKRITQKELANNVGVSRQTIIQLEKNRYNPSLLLAHNIAKYFHVSIEDIFILFSVHLSNFIFYLLDFFIKLIYKHF